MPLEIAAPAPALQTSSVDSLPRWPIVLLIALFAGLALRQWAFDHSTPMRRAVTQQNTFYWGNRIVRAAHPAPGPAAWPDLTRAYLSFYDDLQLHPDPNAPVLDYMPLRLLMAAAWVNQLNLQFGPVSHWQPEFARSFALFSLAMEILGTVALFALIDRCSGKQVATAAAVLLWLNPASIMDAEIWPHSQTWIVPFYLFAILAILNDRHLLAGLLFGIGVMFKAQMMIVAPALILWLSFNRQWRPAVKLTAGVILAMATIASPWLRHASFAWAKAGFAAHVPFDDVLRKDRAQNLPMLLSRFGHMTLHQRLLDLHALHLPIYIEVKTALILLFAILLTLTARGLAQLHRDDDRRLLAAIAAPWALLFFVLGQMDERYLVWGACLSAGAIAVNAQTLLAHLMLTFSAASVLCQSLIYDKPAVHPQLLHALQTLNPITLIFTVAGVAILFHIAAFSATASSPRSTR